MSKKITRIAFMSIIFILTLFSYSFAESQSNPINLIDEFEYKLGDCAVDENGTPLWIINEQSDWKHFKGIQELSAEVNDEDTVWFRVRLPDLEYKNHGIYFQTLYAHNLDIFIGQEQIYHKERTCLQNYNSLLFAFQKSYQNKYLYIRATYYDTKIGPKRFVIIDNYKKLEHMLLTKDIFNVYLGFGLVFLAIAILLSCFFLKNNSKKIGISLTVIVLSIGFILISFRTNFLMFYTNYDALILALYDVSLLCFLPSLTYFFDLIIISKKKSFIRFLWQIQTGYSAFCIFFMFINIIINYKFNTLYLFFTSTLVGILFVIQLITLISTGIYYTYKNNDNAKIFILGFSLFAISLLSEMLIYLLAHKDYDFFVWKWGLIAFILSLVIIFGRQYSKNSEKLHEYSSELNKIDKIARTDYLTNLPNRMDITSKIQQAIDNYRLNNEGFTLVLCDIDNFKNINDTYGHSFGDQVLIQFAEIIKNSIEQSHSVGRWGGEEFLLIVTTQDYNETYNIVEKIRLAIKNHKFIINNTTINITATFGMYEYDSSKSIEKCIECIDEALYCGKKNGKDMVVIYEEANTIEIN